MKLNNCTSDTPIRVFEDRRKIRFIQMIGGSQKNIHFNNLLISLIIHYSSFLLKDIFVIKESIVKSENESDEKDKLF